MYGAGIELTEEDFEFSKPPLSKKFIRLVFEKGVLLRSSVPELSDS